MLHRDEQIVVEYHDFGPQPFYTVSPTAGDVVGTMIFVHGLTEHAFRFLPFARDMALRGIRVVLFHLHGHGTMPRDAELAHWLARAYLSPDAERVIEQIHAAQPDAIAQLDPIVTASIRRMMETRMEEHLDQIDTVARTVVDGRPLLLAGHSLGGLLATHAACRLRDERLTPAGVTLFSPALRSIAPPHTGKAGKAMLGLTWAARQDPRLRFISRALSSAAGSINLRLRTGWGSQYVSDLEPHQRLHTLDPLILTHVTAAYLDRIENLMVQTPGRAADYPCPVLLFAGDCDPIVDTRGSIDFARALAGDGHDLVIYEKTYAHSPLHSTKYPDILRRIDDWLNRIVPAAPRSSRS